MKRPGRISTAIDCLRCALAGLALLATLGLSLLWLVLPGRWPVRRWIEILGWRLILAGFGIRIAVHGNPVPDARTLIVAKHVSWIDIAVVARVADVGFVAKSEIVSWPVIGVLARRYGCIFIDRSNRGDLGDLARKMAGYPRQTGLALFPEGTTTDGSEVLPFRSSLFACIGERWPEIQPVTLDYRGADGKLLSPEERRRVAWLDNDALLQHAFSLAMSGGVTLHVWFEQAFEATDRKHAAARSRDIIAARLAAPDDGAYAAARKRAA